jgi:hypothetical protein
MSPCWASSQLPSSFLLLACWHKHLMPLSGLAQGMEGLGLGKLAPQGGSHRSSAQKSRHRACFSGIIWA